MKNRASMLFTKEYLYFSVVPMWHVSLLLQCDKPSTVGFFRQILLHWGQLKLASFLNLWCRSCDWREEEEREIWWLLTKGGRRATSKCLLSINCICIFCFCVHKPIVLQFDWCLHFIRYHLPLPTSIHSFYIFSSSELTCQLLFKHLLWWQD